MYYWGVKFHLFAQYQKGSLPKPECLEITQASVHDLSAVKHIMSDFKQTEIVADRAYSSKQIRKSLEKLDTVLHTRVKTTKNKKFLTVDEEEYSRIVSTIRQPIESFFNWINEKTGIQNASKVRSKKGLIVHIFGRFAASLLMLVLQGKVSFS